MPEINKNFNIEEYKLLCMNGQKEYCEKTRSITETGDLCEGKIFTYITITSGVYSPDGRCLPTIITETTPPGSLPVYMTLATEPAFPTGTLYEVKLYNDCTSEAVKLPQGSNPLLAEALDVYISIGNTCTGYTWDEERQAYIFTQAF
jgi:hypothetical protein